ncbi:MAG: transglutaminase-like domain-containing protein [Vicinamibacterales bacterium]
MIWPSGQSIARALDDADARPAPDLAPGALVIAGIEYPRLEPPPYLARMEELGAAALAKVAAGAGAEGPLHARVEAVNAYLFGEQGFQGNRDRYADVRNSCLNQVLDRRTGIPITLSVIYMDVARRAGLRAEGINFPGHFLVRVKDAAGPDPAKDAGLIVDPFNEGAILTEQDCRGLLARHDDSMSFSPDLLSRATRRQVFVRMLVNLKRLYVQSRSFPQARAVSEALLTLTPSSLSELRDRGLLSYHLHDYAAALRDLEEYLRLLTLTDKGEEEREETAQVWDHVKTLRRRVASLN